MDAAQDAALVLAKLEADGFDDGFAPQRWLASQEATWEDRASTLLRALAKRHPSTQRQVAGALSASTA